eukprot:jgi/Galph1/4998/GphlegSOOS_G3655.1
MANRKLQAEIEKVLKRVEEGAEVFEEIWLKVHDAPSSTQKEKHENDLKREIKKLQRLRDQLKVWQNDPSIKDKSKIGAARKLIEEKMEKFKICERETKTKAFSREGLSLDRTDPKNKEKQKIREWVTECINALRVQSESLEAEIENASKGKKKKGDNSKLASLQHRLSRHAFHIDRLELLLRAVDNENVSFEEASELRDGVEDYVDNNDDPNFMEDTTLYDSLNLEKSVPVPASSTTLFDNNAKREDDSGSSKLADEKGEKQKSLTSETGSSQSSSEKSSNQSQPQGIKESPKKILSSKNSNRTVNNSPRIPTSYSATVRSSSNSKVSTASGPVTGRPEVNVSVPSAWGSTTNATFKPTTAGNNQTIESSPPRRPFAAAVLEGLQNTGKEERASLSEKTGGEQSSKQKVSTGPSSAQSGAEASEGHKHLLKTVRIAQHRHEMRKTKGKQTNGEAVSNNASPEIFDLSNGASENTPTFSGSASNNESDRSELGVDAGNMRSSLNSSPNITPRQGVHPSTKSSIEANGNLSTETTSSGVMNQEERAALQTLLDASLRCMPEPVDVDLPKNYIPRNPSKFVPSSFPTAPPPVLLSPSLFQHFDTDTLFFIFYFQPGTYQQYLAAKELKRQSWRFHRKYMTWFQRHEEPQVVEADHEQGTYVYFDYALNDDAGWCQRIKSEFTFEYAYLEDELPIDA